MGCDLKSMRIYMVVVVMVWVVAGAHANTGLREGFYNQSCPMAEAIVRSHLINILREEPKIAAPLLRLHFHDCFVKGCDASILLEGTPTHPGEKVAPPNANLRTIAYDIVDKLRQILNSECGNNVVSCADIITLAARDSVHLSGGPDFAVPLGRRDSIAFASLDETLNNLPSPSSNASTILKAFATKGLSPTDLVALSGAHTIGISPCVSFSRRLYPVQDPSMDPAFADNLKKICPADNTNATTVMEGTTPEGFDNKYYLHLINRQGLFVSDQDLYTHDETRGIVTRFAEDQAAFFHSFTEAMLKMGQLNVLTGNLGQVRLNCSIPN